MYQTKTSASYFEMPRVDSITLPKNGQMGLFVQSSTPVRGVRNYTFPAVNPFTPDAIPIQLIAEGKRIPSWKIDENGLCGSLPESPVKVSTKTDEITLIPMGADRLRISVFPVVR